MEPNKPTSDTPSWTVALEARRRGDDGSIGPLLETLRTELRAIAGRLMAHESPSHTLQPTALVNEAYMRLSRQESLSEKNRNEFLAIAANVMRQILIDHARVKRAKKRNRGAKPMDIADADVAGHREFSEDDLLSLDEALEELAVANPRAAKVVECKFFAGLTNAQIADVVGISKRMVDIDWAAAKAWLNERLSGK